jgi:hypothetical protein
VECLCRAGKRNPLDESENEQVEQVEAFTLVLYLSGTSF